jgi:hypothetical protein
MRTAICLILALLGATQSAAAEERPLPVAPLELTCYTVGDPVPGGVCAEAGAGALVVAAENSPTSMEWDGRRWSKEEGFTSSGSMVGATHLTDGRPNQALLLVRKSVAARYCDGLRLGGYKDWYLPARDELLLLRKHQKKIGGFLATPYWSSSEFNATSAWMVDFSSGASFIFPKETKRPVRCVRRLAI